MNKFKIGDYVVANEKGNIKYRITDSRMIKGEVIGFTDDIVEDIRVKVIDHKNKAKIGEEHEVDSSYFNLLEERTIDAPLTWSDLERNMWKEGLKLSEEPAKAIKHKSICEDLNKLYKAKHEDYGDSFGKSYNEFGLTMLAIRLDDKLNRLKSFAEKQDMKVKDESIIDTLMDLANYSIMGIIEIMEDED